MDDVINAALNVATADIISKMYKFDVTKESRADYNELFILGENEEETNKLRERFRNICAKFPSFNIGIPFSEYWDKDGVGHRLYGLSIYMTLPKNEKESYVVHFSIEDKDSWDSVFEVFERPRTKGGIFIEMRDEDGNYLGKKTFDKYE